MELGTNRVGRRGVLLGAAGLGGLAVCAGAAPALAAGTGRQSPIDIDTAAAVRSPGFGPLIVDYPTSVDLDLTYIQRDGDDEDGCETRAEDETIQAQNFSERAVLRREGEVYELVQTHFHLTSEHAVDGRRFPMEQHFVHRRVSDGALLVIGVFLVPGGPDDAAPQDRLLRVLPEECSEAPRRLRGLSLRRMMPSSLASWTYRGSLTTAPYSQQVLWHVMREPKRVDPEDIRRFRRLFTEGDSRALQPRNGRSVRLVRGRLARQV